MKQEWKDKMEYVTHFYMDISYKNCYVGILQMQYDGIQFYFIDNEYYFSGPKPYGYLGVCFADPAAWLVTGIMLLIAYLAWKHQMSEHIKACEE